MGRKEVMCRILGKLDVDSAITNIIDLQGHAVRTYLGGPSKFNELFVFGGFAIRTDKPT
jgi:hypothetical protein